MNYFTKKKLEEFEEVVGQAIGEASMCWSETPKGVFESDNACKILEKVKSFLTTALEEQRERLLLDIEDTMNKHSHEYGDRKDFIKFIVKHQRGEL